MERNINKVQIIAKALDTLKEHVVFVGGSVAELYAKSPELSDIRPTIDVDCVIDLQIITYIDYSKLEEQLRGLGFQNDTSKGAPICRKLYRGIIVDFLPVNPDILGFSNVWYEDGVANKMNVTLPNRTSIFILPVEYYLATKIEALKNRGGSDIRGSHDWEDIVYILYNCEDVLLRIKQCSNRKLVNYIQKEICNLLNNNNIKEIIYVALPYDSEEESIDEVLDLMNNICAIES